MAHGEMVMLGGYTTFAARTNHFAAISSAVDYR